MFSLIICILIGCAIGLGVVTVLGWILCALVDIIDSLIKLLFGID